MTESISRACVIAALILALGLAAAGFLFGQQAKHIGRGRQSISVKGLAEKPVQADMAEWTVTTEVVGPSFAEALAALRAQQPKVREFLSAQGFDPAQIGEADETVAPHFVEEEAAEGRTRSVQKGYEARQSLTVKSKDLARVAAAHKAILQFIAAGNPVSDDPPLYVLSNLEEIKMSLIGAATQNALQRATEFAKSSNAKVGTLRSASQGAFYILPEGAGMDVDDYGGRYDKSTVAKIARVVVTIEYNIED